MTNKKTWTSNVSDIALMYGLPEEEVEQRMYTLAEHIHSHYCLSRGIVNHHEARPDQDVAISILGALAGTDWFLMHGDDIIRPSSSLDEGGSLTLAGEIPLYSGEIIIGLNEDETNDTT